MRFHNFRCISFLSSKFLNHVQKTPKNWEKICSITIFHQDPEKHFNRPENPSKLPLFFQSLFQTIMNKSLGTLLHFWVFSNSHRSNPSPHTTNNVGCMYPEFFSEFQLCIGWGEGQLQENFENAALPRLFGDWVETLLLPAFVKISRLHIMHISALRWTEFHQNRKDPIWRKKLRIFRKMLFSWEGLLNAGKRQQIAKNIIAICLHCLKSLAFTRP